MVNKTEIIPQKDILETFGQQLMRFEWQYCFMVMFEIADAYTNPSGAFT